MLHLSLYCTMAIATHRATSTPDVYLSTVELVRGLLEHASVPVSRTGCSLD